MKLEQILEIATECVNNEKIPIDGLTLFYKIDAESHKKLDEELFYKINNDLGSFKHNEIVELTIADVTFIFEIQ